MIDIHSIETLKSRIDIVDIIGHYLELKKSGASFKALCPFHNDASPSLHVSPTKQIYHCFACGAGGDAIKFIMEYEKLTYPETLEKIASIYNFSLTYTKQDNQNRQDKKVLEVIQKYYQSLLEKTPKALEYLKSRDLTQESIDKFAIGYAPTSSSTLQFLRENGINVHDAIEVGVAGIGERGDTYARFIERITFPIHSPSGKIVGFGGRTISGHPAKYVNSPQSKIFNKSNILYGYHLAKENILKKNQIIVTEGYLDVIMLHQAGFKNTVATLGTALTSEHLPLLLRGSPEVILSYDGDDAGIEAAFRASLMLSLKSTQGGVVIFRNGLDPADMVQNHKIDLLNQYFNKPIPFIEFCIEMIIKKHDLKDPLQKQKALEEGIQYLKTLPRSIAENYRSFLASLLDLRVQFINLGREKNVQKDYLKNSFEDTLELSIIKTLLEYPSQLDTVLDIIDISMFRVHKEEFELVLKEDYEHSLLKKIQLREDIFIHEESNIIESLISLLVLHYTKKIEQVKLSKTISFEQKTFLLRKMQNILMRLKSGELVPYESFDF